MSVYARAPLHDLCRQEYRDAETSAGGTGLRGTSILVCRDALRDAPRRLGRELRDANTRVQLFEDGKELLGALDELGAPLCLDEGDG